jgi:hypothetical protein
MPAGAFLSETASKSYALQVNGVDVLPSVPLDEVPVTWSDQAANGVGTLEFTVEDRGSWAARVPLVVGADVKLRDTAQASPLFGGTLLRVKHVRGVTGRFSDVTCVDYDWWLDRRIVPTFRSQPDTGKRTRRHISDRAVVASLIERRLPMLHGSWEYIDLTNSAMPLIEVEGVTARQALEEIADAAQTGTDPYPRRFYVDASRKVHWYKNNEGVAAPYVVGAAGIEVEDLELEDGDGSDIVHHVYVRGKDKDGSGWVYNKGSDFAIGATSAFLDRPKSKTVPDRNRGGHAFLRRQEVVRAGSFTIQATSGWRSGQAVTITDSQLGLAAEKFEIKVVNGELGRGSHVVHRIEFGAPKRWLTRDLRRRDIL